MKEETKLILGAIAIILIALIANKLINKTSSGVASVLSGDIFTSENEKQQQKQSETAFKKVNWYDKANKLAKKEHTTITVGTARSIADTLAGYLDDKFHTPTNNNLIYKTLEQLKTLGSFYFVVQNYGVRDSMDLPTALRKKMGYDNVLSKDLKDVNEMFKKKGFSATI